MLIKVVCTRSTWEGYDIEVHAFDSHKAALEGVAKIVKRQDVSIKEIFDFTEMGSNLPLDVVRKFLTATTHFDFIETLIRQGSNYAGGEKAVLVSKSLSTLSSSWVVFEFMGKHYMLEGEPGARQMRWKPIAEIVEAVQVATPQPDQLVWKTSTRVS